MFCTSYELDSSRQLHHQVTVKVTEVKNGNETFPSLLSFQEANQIQSYILN